MASKTLPQDVVPVVQALTRTLAPAVPDLDVTGVEDFVVQESGRMIFELPRLSRCVLLLGFRLFEWLPGFSGFTFRRFTFLSESDQAKYVDKWVYHRRRWRRELFKALKGIILLIFFSDKRVWKYMGYEPEEHMAFKLKQHEEVMSRKSEV